MLTSHYSTHQVRFHLLNSNKRQTLCFAMSLNAASPKPVHAKLSRRFYEAVKLEEALVLALRKDPSYAGKVPPETETLMDYRDEEAFRSSLNKFSHVCDTKRGGETVSAVVPIVEFDCIRWFLASNGRKTSDNATLKSFFRGLLEMPLSIPPGTRTTDTAEFVGLLEDIVVFNKPRISFYTRTLAQRLGDSLDKFDGRQSDEQQGQSRKKTQQDQRNLIENSVLERTREALRHVQSLIASDMDANGEMPAGSTVTFIRYLQRTFHRGTVARMISRLCDESAYNPQSCWFAIRHLISRLRAYHVSAETILESKMRWPELFEHIEITVVPPSKPAENPLRASSHSLHAAIGRMTSDRSKLTELREQVRWLDRFGLEETYREVCSSPAFKPWVHAEVGAHEAVRKHLDSNPGFKFWRGIRYIGSSKPACRLCHYYFREVGDSVAVRETHDNLYPKWRLPDCFDEADEKRRESLLNAIIKYTRQDTVLVINEKTPRGSANDSTSNPTVPFRLQHRGPGTVNSLGDITEAFENVSLSEPGKAAARANADGSEVILPLREKSFRNDVKTTYVIEARDVGNEVDGGVSLL